MSKTVRVTVYPADIATQELLVAELSESGFEGFEQKDTELDAFIEDVLFKEDIIQQLTGKYGLHYTVEYINEQNWNALWESNFEPVQVNNFVAIRANFHPPVTEVEHEIIITPKMSFGTGHHATTFMMVEQMQLLPFKHASVFDFGTGTGILSILAEKLGATAITAIDNDDWSIDNARENFTTNHTERIRLFKADKPPEQGLFEIILANINKHIILQNLSSLYSLLQKNGTLLVSGLLAADEKDIQEYAVKTGLQHRKTVYRDQWIAMLFTA